MAYIRVSSAEAIRHIPKFGDELWYVNKNGGDNGFLEAI